jgi:hypothetical protein
MNSLIEPVSTLQPHGAALLLGRLGLDLLCTTVVVRHVYYRLYRNRDYTFTCFLINLVTFSIASLLSAVPIELGFALGLFAVFGILRYRTEAIPVRNLTYLFVVIGLALLNALASRGITIAELGIANVVLVGAVAWLEAAPSSSREESRLIRYDRLDLLDPSVTQELLADLRTRTRLPIERIEIGNVDLLRDCADLVVYYRARPHSAASSS